MGSDVELEVAMGDDAQVGRTGRAAAKLFKLELSISHHPMRTVEV